MYPFNVINWVKVVLLSGIMSVLIGAVFVGIRWRFWDLNWQREQNRIFDSVCEFVNITIFCGEIVKYILFSAGECE